MDDILNGRRPAYDWPIDVSPEFIEQNGFFSVGRSFIKALLCLLAQKGPRSFGSNVPVRLDNDWLKQANSRNYHHFFPKAWLRKQGWDERKINHIANITLVDEISNKREIKAQPPGTYIRRFQRENEHLDRTLATHLIGKPEAFGILANDYDAFFRKRCHKFSSELKKRILPAEADDRMTAAPAFETADAWTPENDTENEV